MRCFSVFLFGLIFFFPAAVVKAAQQTALFGVLIGATESQFLPAFKESQFKCAHKTEYEVECKRGEDNPPTQSIQYLSYLLTRSQPARVYSVQFSFHKISLKPTDLVDQISETYDARPVLYDPSVDCLVSNRCHVLWLLDEGILASLNLNGPSSDGIYHYILKIAHAATLAREMGMENPFDAAAKKMEHLKNALEQTKKELHELRSR